MKVEPTKEVLHKGIWYKPGEDVPEDKKQFKKKEITKKSEVE